MTKRVCICDAVGFALNHIYNKIKAKMANLLCWLAKAGKVEGGQKAHKL